MRLPGHSRCFNGALRLALFIVTFAATLAVLHAQGGGETPPRTIRDVRVEGAQTSSPSAIIAISGIRPGDQWTPTSDVIVKAIRSLMDRRLFSDVRVYADEVTDKDMIIVIAVKEYQRIGAIRFAGNDEVSEKDLSDLVTVRTGDITSPYELDRSRAKIRKKYAEEGYYFTKVSFAQAASADSGRIDVTFTVDEGPQLRVRSITFEGNHAFDASDLKGSMENITEKKWWQFWKSRALKASSTAVLPTTVETRNQRITYSGVQLAAGSVTNLPQQLAADESHIKEFYRSHGYIDADIVRDSVNIDPATGETDFNIRVSEGSIVYLRSLTIAGNTAYPAATIERRLDAAIGRPYNAVQLDKNLTGNDEQTDVRSLYLDNGYLTFDGRLEEKRSSPDSVDVVIHLQEGGQSSVRFVSITGNTKTRDKVIRRELYTRPGDTFSKASVIRSLRNLANLNYFNPEKLHPDVRPVDATSVDIAYQVEERPSDTFNASLGLSSQGLTGMLGVSFNNFSILEPLSGGSGQVLNFNWEFGSYVTTFLLGFTEPWLFDDPTSLGASVSFQTRDLLSYKLQQAGGTVNLGRRLSWPDDYFRLDGGISFRSNRITGDATQSVYYRNGTELTLTAAISRSSIDNPIFPTGGSRFSFSNTIAGIGDAKYSKHELHFEFFSPLAQITEQNPVVFYIGNEYGYLNDFGPLTSIPPSAFYSMGGTGIGGFNITPLRGYLDGSIGPVGADQIPIGKLYSKITSELRLGIALNPIPLYVLGFAEAGNVWGRFRDVDPFDLRRSMGLGLRVTIPGVGLLGFDYGYGFDRDSQGRLGGWQFHFQFGR